MGGLGSPVGPFAEPKIEANTAAAISGFGDRTIGNFNSENINLPEPPKPVIDSPETMGGDFQIPDLGAPEPVQQESIQQEPVQQQTTNENDFQANDDKSLNNDIEKVKEAALRDLMPLLDKMKINPEEKFRIYRDGIEKLGDNSMFGFAYNAAKEIADENARGEALLYIVEKIDNK